MCGASSASSAWVAARKRSHAAASSACCDEAGAVSTTTLSSEPVLVATKLHVPPLREGSVPRSDLLARLLAGRERKLTLLCAPAGWGKTMLLSAWHESAEETRPFA